MNIKLNPKNIITTITLWDFERQNIRAKLFLTKQGTVYNLKHQYLNEKQTRELIGTNGNELLKAYSKETDEIFNPQKGIIVLDDTLINKYLEV